MRRSTLVLAVTAVLAPVTIAAVGPRMGDLRGTLGFDANFNVAGTMLRGTVTPTSDLSPIDPIGYGSIPENFVGNDVSSHDVQTYANGGSAELSYGMTNNIEIYGQIGYMHQRLGTVQIGVIDFAPDDLALFGDFSQFQSWRGVVGARYYMDGESFRPFIGAEAGVEHTTAIDLRVRTADFALDTEFFNLYESTTAFTGGVELGAAFGFADSIDGVISVGVRYTDALKRADLSTLGGFGNWNDNTGRWIIPARARLSVRF